jgi:hypothetical protein
MFFRRRKRARRTGCSLLVTATLVTCALLVMNRIVVASLYVVTVPSNLDYPQGRTVVSTLAMIGLLLPEWWLIDWLTAKLKMMYRWIEASQRDVEI